MVPFEYLWPLLQEHGWKFIAMAAGVGGLKLFFLALKNRNRI